MLRHIVMWTLKDLADAPQVKALLDSCKGLVPGMHEFDVGIKADVEANVARAVAQFGGLDILINTVRSEGRLLCSGTLQ